MLGEHHHDLTHEFPEYKDKIHELKSSDNHFARLYEEYQEVDKEVFRIEEEIETPSDDYTEELKKKRLQLKDELYAILQKS
ncbi:MAG: YdcH family protein [Gammaproteobacteria bacterium]|nr:YdcH family protein [Gammaproteobacteria bacterium]